MIPQNKVCYLVVDNSKNMSRRNLKYYTIIVITYTYIYNNFR